VNVLSTHAGVATVERLVKPVGVQEQQLAEVAAVKRADDQRDGDVIQQRLRHFM